MNVVVHDEDELVLEVIRNYFKKHNVAGWYTSIKYYSDIDEMLISLKDHVYDIFLLGVQIKGIPKIGRVMHIRDKDNRIITFEQFRSGISKVWRKYASHNAVYIGWFHGEKIELKIKDIYIFESCRRETYVKTDKRVYRVNGTLNQEEEKLPRFYFARISQGEMVNLFHVDRIEKEYVYLDNGEVKFCSIRRMLQTMEKWEVYGKHYKV